LGYHRQRERRKASDGRLPGSYTSFLNANGLAGMRFGVNRTPMSKDTDTNAADYKEIQSAISNALAVLVARGAEVIDPLPIPGLVDGLAATGGGGGAETEAAIDAFLAGQPNAPVHSLREIVASPLVSSKRRAELERNLGRTREDSAYAKQQAARETLRTLVLGIMADNRLDALIYATSTTLPRRFPNRRLGPIGFSLRRWHFQRLPYPRAFSAMVFPSDCNFLAGRMTRACCSRRPLITSRRRNTAIRRR
jgi:amidase